MSREIVRAALCVVLLSPPLAADEFSILSDSTVIGRNLGYPSGDPLRAAADPGEIELGVETLFFFKNLELTGFDDETMIDGETFIGFLAPLRFRYRAHRQLHLEAGAVLGQNFGDDDELDVAQPLVRLVVEPAANLYLVAGTLLATHWIHDAILDDVLVFREGTEQGFQFRADREIFKQDTWINWRIRETSIEPEEFEIGNSSQLRIAGFRVDAQVLWAHVGGQLNASDRVENNITALGGASYGAGVGEFFEDIRLGGYYLASSDDRRGASATSGSGVEARLTMDMRPAPDVLARLFGAYFHGDDFLAPRGDLLYKLDDYAQLGVQAIFQLAEALRIETGIAAHLGDDELVSTYLVNFVWGRNFPLLKLDTPAAVSPSASAER